MIGYEFRIKKMRNNWVLELIEKEDNKPVIEPKKLITKKQLERMLSKNKYMTLIKLVYPVILKEIESEAKTNSNYDLAYIINNYLRDLNLLLTLVDVMNFIRQKVPTIQFDDLKLILYLILLLSECKNLDELRKYHINDMVMKIIGCYITPNVITEDKCREFLKKLIAIRNAIFTALYDGKFRKEISYELFKLFLETIPSEIEDDLKQVFKKKWEIIEKDETLKTIVENWMKKEIDILQ